MYTNQQWDRSKSVSHQTPMQTCQIVRKVFFKCLRNQQPMSRNWEFKSTSSKRTITSNREFRFCFPHPWIFLLSNQTESRNSTQSKETKGIQWKKIQIINHSALRCVRLRGRKFMEIYQKYESESSYTHFFFLLSGNLDAISRKVTAF